MQTTRISTLAVLGVFSQVALAQDVDPANDPFNPQRYIPKDAYAYAGFGVYMAIVAIYAAWSIRYRASYMFIAMVSAALYSIGLILRVVFANDPHSVSRFIAMRLMTLIPVGGLFIFLYILAIQLAVHLDASHLLLLRPGLIITIYPMIDLVCIGIQSAGAAISPSSLADNQNLGKKLLLIGFVIQLVSFATFTAIYVVFVLRYRKHNTAAWKARPFGRFKHFSWLAIVIGFACQNLLIRTAYRVLEAAQGPNGKLAKSETWFYMLDALQLLNVVLGFVGLWPPYYLRPAMKIPSGISSNVELNGSLEPNKDASPGAVYTAV